MRLLLVVSLLSLALRAEASTSLTIQVSDLSDRPIAGVIVSAKAPSSTSAPTDVAGKTQLVISGSLNPGDAVELVLVKAPAGLLFYSPWHGQAVMPQVNRAIDITLGSLGNRTALSNAKVVSTFASAIQSQSTQTGADSPQGKATILSDLARSFELNPIDVDKAIRNLAGHEGNFQNQKLLANQSATASRYVMVMPTEKALRLCNSGACIM